MQAQVAYAADKEFDDIVRRVTSGFEQRLATARKIYERCSTDPRFEGRLPTILEIPLEIVRDQDSNHRFFQISATIGSAKLATQQAIVASLTDKSDIAIVSALAIGQLRNDHELTLSALEELPDEELSTVLESVSRFGRQGEILPEIVMAEIEALSGAFIANILEMFDAFPRPGFVAGRSEPFAQAVFENFGRFKRRSLRFAGPDISSVFQLMADPSLTPTVNGLKAMRNLAVEWKLDEEFDSLLFARVIQKRETERRFVLENIDSILIKRRLAPQLSTDLFVTMGEHPAQPFSARRRPVSRLHQQAFLSAKLNVALRQTNLPEIYASIIAVFNFDKGLIKFIDWDRVTAAIRRNFDVTVESAFVTMLLSDPEVRTHHARAALSMGKGALIGDLTALLRMGGAQAVNLAKLLAQIKTLPGEASGAMTHAILKRDIVERLAAALTRRSASRRPFLPDGESAYISFLRVEALKDAGMKGMIPLDIVTQEIDAEIQQVRYNYFQDRMRVGRVRIRWPEIKAAVSKILNETAPIGFLRTLSAKEAVEEVIPRLKDFITDKMTSYVLYDGPFSVDHALSDNLRHGIVVPRFLKTFDDALQTIARRHRLSGWEQDELVPIFGANASDILRYRDLVADTIKSFVDVDLVVQFNGQLHKSTRSGIAKVLDAYFKTDFKTKVAGYEGRLARVIEKSLKQALGRAGRRLSDEIKRGMILDLRTLRGKLKQGAGNQTRDFLDSLETNLHAAFEETRQWIGVADNVGNVIPFSLKEVVDLELLTTQFNELARLKVSVDQQLTKADGSTTEEFAIQGSYLVAFESVIHNLMSNAFKYSGAKLQTDVKFQLKLSSRRLLVRAENKVTAEAISNVIKNHGRTAQLARKTVGPEVRQDKQPGFQKIRSALARDFGADVTINIPPPSEKNRLFVVEVSIALDKEIWVGN